MELYAGMLACWHIRICINACFLLGPTHFFKIIVNDGSGLHLQLVLRAHVTEGANERCNEVIDFGFRVFMFCFHTELVLRSDELLCE